MARIRTIKPSFWKSESMCSVGPWTRLLFIGLWNIADDGGNYPLKLSNIKMELFPDNGEQNQPNNQIKSDTIRRLLIELEQLKSLFFYEVSGEYFIHIINFLRYQRIEKRTYACPLEDCPGAKVVNSSEIKYLGGSNSATPRRPLDPGREWKGMEESESDLFSPIKESNTESYGHIANLHEKAIELWNATALPLGLATVRAKISDARKSKLTRRLNEIGGLPGWQTMLGKIQASKFLRGRNNHDWAVTFDWVLSPENLAKLMEGNYDDKRGDKARRDIDAYLDRVTGS